MENIEVGGVEGSIVREKLIEDINKKEFHMKVAVNILKESERLKEKVESL
jgi:hypothetical protein